MDVPALEIIANSDARSINGEPISASRLEAWKCPFLYWGTYVKKPKLFLPKNAEYHYGDAEHRARDDAFETNFADSRSFANQKLMIWEEAYKPCLDQDERQAGIHHPIPGRSVHFYRDYLLNSLRDFYDHPGNRKLTARVLLERSELKKRVEKEVHEEYLKQLQAVKVTKKRLHKPTKQMIDEIFDKESELLWPRREQEIVFKWDYNGNSYLLSAKPDFLAKLSDERFVYPDYKIGHDMMEWQFAIAKLAIESRYAPRELTMYKNHIYSREGKRGFEKVVIADSDINRFGAALESFYHGTQDIHKALAIRKKFGWPCERKGQQGTEFLTEEIEWANGLLDVRNFPRKKFAHCDICDLHVIGKQMTESTTEKDIENFIKIYWNTFALGSERMWRGLNSRAKPCGR